MTMRITLRKAVAEDAPAIALLRAEVAADLTARFGKGVWTGAGTERGVLFDLRHSALYVWTRRNRVVASLRLATKKPWAIDIRYFTPCQRPLYLLSMAVHPDWQRKGVGRGCIAEAVRLAVHWPADAIRLDAFDAPAGAGEFYRKCGLREVARVTYKGNPLIYFERLV
jgi:GNAT superfamily N-acetyltransferase